MRYLLGCVVLALVITTPGPAQVFISKADSGRKVLRIEGEGTFLPEIGAVVGMQENEFRVIHAMPAEARPKTSAPVDIRTDDRILMVNAKPAKSAEVFRKFYEAASPGDTIKLGIKRGEELHIVIFVKADPKDLPKGNRMIIRKRD